jgi:hypothetical protein
MWQCLEQQRCERSVQSTHPHVHFDQHQHLQLLNYIFNCGQIFLFYVQSIERFETPSKV